MYACWRICMALKLSLYLLYLYSILWNISVSSSLLRNLEFLSAVGIFHILQDHERCRDLLSSITTTVQCRLPVYLSHLQYLIERPSCDRLSVISSEVILMAYIHFSVTPEQVPSSIIQSEVLHRFSVHPVSL